MRRASSTGASLCHKSAARRQGASAHDPQVASAHSRRRTCHRSQRREHRERGASKREQRIRPERSRVHAPEGVLEREKRRRAQWRWRWFAAAAQKRRGAAPGGVQGVNRCTGKSERRTWPPTRRLRRAPPRARSLLALLRAMSALTLALPALRCRGSAAPRRVAARCSAAAAPRVLLCVGAAVLAGRASPLRACVAARSSRLRATRRVVLAAQASAEGKQLVQDEEQSITKACGGWGATRPVRAADAAAPRAPPAAGLIRHDWLERWCHAASCGLPGLLQLHQNQRQLALRAAAHLWLPHLTHRCRPSVHAERVCTPR